MTAFAVWTWSAIVILIVGSSGVFVWFLGDAWRMMRALERHPQPTISDPPPTDPTDQSPL